MSSRTVQIIGGDARQHAYVDGPTNALLVKVVNPSSGGGGVQYNEDTAHASGDTGTMALVVRKDAAGSLVSADGDYAPLQVDASGALRVTGGGGGTQYQEDAAHTTGDTGTMALVVRQDTPGALAGTDGDYAPLQVDATGRLRVTVDASVALSVSNFPAVQPVNDNGGSLTVDGTVAATQSGTWTTTVTQATHANLNAQIRLQDKDSSGLLSVLKSGLAGTFPLDEYGLLPLFEVNDNPTAGGGTFQHGFMNETGAIYVAVTSGTVAIAGTVAVTQSGAWTVAATQSGAWTVTVNQPVAVTDNAGSLTVDGTVAVSSVGGTVAVTQSGAWTVAATQSGTWNIATVTTVSSVSAVIPGTGATNIGKAEDAVHASGDTGVFALAVRGDAETGLVSSNGDYAPLLVNSVGRLKANSIIQGGTNFFGLLDVVSTGDPPVGGGPAGVTVQCEVQDLGSGTQTLGRFNHMFMDSNTGGVWAHIVNDLTIQTMPAVGISSVVPGTTATSLGKAEDAVHATGDTGVFMLSVRKDTATQLAGTDGDYAPLITDASGRLHVNVGNSTLAVTQSGTWNVGTVTTVTTVTTVSTVSSVSAVIAGTGATNLGKAEDAAHTTGDTGVFALAVRTDTATQRAGTDGDYSPFITDSSGRLHVNGFVTEVSPGSAKLNLGKLEDAAHADGDLGVMALVVRRDTLVASAGTTGNYSPMAVDAVGALWVRSADMTTIALSGSTRGRPIQIAATATLGTTIHTATTTSGQLDRLFLWLTNTSSSAVTVTIEFGAAGTGLNVKIVVPANETVLAIDGAVIGGAATDTVTAFASVTNVVNAFGRVERLG
jgi:hypothetical protein